MINIALIGCGRVGARHAKILSDYEVEGARLCAVADIRQDRARQFGINNGALPWFLTNCGDDMTAIMIEATKPDLITIATPSGCHYEHVKAMAKFGIPLLVEKPLALTLRDVDRIGKLPIPVGEVKQNRYNVAVQRLKQAMLEERLGRPRIASVRVLWSRNADYYDDWHGEWKMSGGVLANQAIHHIDLLWWLLGDVEWVSAMATYDDYTEVETGLVANMKFKSGCLGTVEVTTLTRPKDLEGSLMILGDSGIVELGGFAVNKIKTWQFSTAKPVDAAIQREGENPPDVYGFGHIELYRDIVKRLEEGKGFPVTFDQSYKALEIVHAIYEAMETRCVINVGEVAYTHSRLGK